MGAQKGGDARLYNGGAECIWGPAWGCIRGVYRACRYEVHEGFMHGDPIRSGPGYEVRGTRYEIRISGGGVGAAWGPRGGPAVRVGDR